MLRLFIRHELKYLLPLWKSVQIMAGLQGRMSRDAHCASGGYAVTSLYYDTHNLDSFWARRDAPIRRTLRIRVYPDAAREGIAVGMVELKQRIAQVVQKRRLPVPLGLAEQICAGQIDEAQHAQLPPSDLALAAEIARLAGSTRMRPVAVTAYTRTAFFDEERGQGLRITFDTDLRGRVDALKLNQRARDHRILGEDWCVMEIKSDQAVPEWLTATLLGHGAHPQRMSKYRLVMSRLSGGALPPRPLALCAWTK